MLAEPLGARGSAAGDLDGDGRVDLVLARIDGPAGLGINRTGAGNTRLVLRLLGAAGRGPAGRTTPRDGHGAKAVLVVGEGAGEHALLSETQNSVGYQSASTLHLHFGLGRETRYRELKLLWPSGRVERLPGGAGGRKLVIEEGKGIVREEPLR
jgi:hypothetical protein